MYNDNVKWQQDYSNYISLIMKENIYDIDKILNKYLYCHIIKFICDIF